MRVTRFRPPLLQAAAVIVAALILALPTASHAFWRGGVFIGVPPVVVGPPIYYPPPVYYVPPVLYGPAPPGQSCYAGAYICPLTAPAAVGEPCSCRANNGGRVSGRAG
jgi:hypothetical protein